MLATNILILDGAQASSVAITMDVLALANHRCRAMGRTPAFDVALTGAGARHFRPFLAFPEGAHAVPQLLIIPAQGFSKAVSYKERLALGDVAAANAQILAAADAGAQITGSCTGTLLLANSGLLDGRTATTAWWLTPVFQQLFPAVSLRSSELIVEDGQFITAGAAMAQMDLMVRLVARHAGSEIAAACANTMVLDERRSQTPYMAISLLAASNDSVARAAAWARASLHRDISVQQLATIAGQSSRTFARRVHAATGMSPIHFLQQIRMERAVEMLETTQLSFEEIAFRVGYHDPSTLRSIIRQRVGMGPRDLRDRARSARALRS